MRLLQLIAALIIGVASSASAELRPGDLFLVDPGTGSVHNIRNGGDFSSAPPFASGLEVPDGLCIGPAGNLYVGEYDGNSIRVITAGGDASTSAPFATGIHNIVPLVCNSEQILAGGQTQGVIDATEGGDFSGAASFAEGLGIVNGMFRDSNGRLWVADRGENRIWDATDGGDFAARTPFVTNVDNPIGIAELDGRLLVVEAVAGIVVDFTAGGDFATLPVFATLPSVVNILALPDGRLLAATPTAVYDITGGGNFAAATPFASGFIATDAGAMVYVEGPCTATPAPSCLVASKASLSIVEKKPGNEKWKLSLAGFDSATLLSAYGDPVSADTAYGVCLYDADEKLIADLEVDLSASLCGPKQKSCWKGSSKGFSYKDADASASGVKKLTTRTGALGKGKIKVQAGNRAKKGQSALPTEVAFALQGQGRAFVQVVTTDAECFEAELVDVKKADGLQFKARAQ